MTPNQYPSFIIVGIRIDGQRFRPSDWSERLAGTIATINLDRRMVYSPYVQPGQYDNLPCVYVKLSDPATGTAGLCFFGKFRPR
jgi:hypothetical protein